MEDEVLVEICSSDDTFTWLCPNDRAVYYMFSADRTNELRFFDEIGGNEETVPHQEAVTATLGWSPSQRYLAFLTREERFRDYPGGRATRRTWLMIHDSQVGQSRRVSDLDAVVESEAVWITDDQLVFRVRNLDDPRGSMSRWVYDPGTGRHERCENVSKLRAIPELLDTANTLVRLRDEAVLAVRGDEIRAVDLAAGKVTDLSGRWHGKVDHLEWIRPNAEGTSLLFCGRTAESTNRNLFRLTLDEGKLERLTHEHSYNGKWIEGGRGYAYVGNTNNCFFLAVRRADGTATDLFTSGWVRSYWPNPSGTAIYAEASVDAGPCGLWKYELEGRHLRRLRPGNKVPLVRSKIVAPDSRRYPSFDGLEIPTYLFAAVKGAGAVARGTVVGIPPPTDQCNRYYQPRPQVLSNLGFDYVGINYRGCDGYGLAYSALFDEALAARDVVTVVRRMRESGVIGTGPLYLVCQSGSGGVFRRVLELEPRLWTGCIAVKSALGGVPKIDASTKRPPLLFVIGDSDPLLPVVRRELESIEASGWACDFALIDNYAHLNVNPFGRRTKERRIAEFLREHPGP